MALLAKGVFASIFLISIFSLIDCRAIDPRCQAMRIPFCVGLYESVYFPNFLGHQTQEDAYTAMNKLWPLIKEECSPQILHYFCRLYAPQCPFMANERDETYFTYNPDQYRPPCEDACARVRYDCYPIMAQHHIEWPRELDCQQLRDKSCIETPQIEVEPKTTDRPQPEPVAVPVPEPQPEPETTTEETTTQQTVVVEPSTEEPATVAPETESPEVPSVEEDDDETTTEETSTVTHADDGLIEITTVTPDKEEDNKIDPPAEEETTTHATTVSSAEPEDELEEPDYPVPTEEETTTEEATTTAEPITAEPTTEEPATTTELLTTLAPVPLEPETEAPTTAETTTEEATTTTTESTDSISDTTTGSLLGITSVIEDNRGEVGSGELEQEEATTTAVLEPEVEAATVGSVDAAAEEEAATVPDTTVEAVTSEEVTTSSSGPEVMEPADPEKPNAAVDESPRSDRATGNRASSKLASPSTTYLGLMIIYLASLSFITRRGA